MVEPVSLTLGAVVAALVAKAAEKAGERAVESGAGVLSRLVGRLRQRFTGDGDAAATNALDQVEDAPDSPSRLKLLTEVVDRRAAADADFRSELETLVHEARAEGVDVGSITQTVWGDQNVQVAGIVGSDVNVTYGHPPPAPER